MDSCIRFIPKVRHSELDKTGDNYGPDTDEMIDHDHFNGFIGKKKSLLPVLRKTLERLAVIFKWLIFQKTFLKEEPMVLQSCPIAFTGNIALCHRSKSTV